ncbi:MAG: DUF4349 domain-containing protein [Clostridiales bacterium]|nr:DUF4349 domain-containing protein [Clostridiales bacterium]
MKKKIITVLMACVIGGSFIVGCSKASDKKSSKKSRSDDVEDYYDEEIAYETTVARYNAKSNSLSMNMGDYEDAALESYAEYEEETVDPGDRSALQNAPDSNVDVSKEMLVYRCTMSIDTLNFDESLTALKTKVAEYHGFVERENQSDGNNGNGRYILDEEDKDYYYTATIRIPSEYYESFVSATEGIGTLRSKNSSVDNVATRYGTLKNELEIYEAEYDRYLKQYNETKDEQVALEIQRELRNLAITISDIKTQMSSLESDVAYSYITVTIHKVSEKAVKKEKEEVKEEDSFGTRIGKKAKQSWNNLVDFFEGIVLGIVGAWWGISIGLIVFLVLFFVIRHKIKKAKKNKLSAEKAPVTEDAGKTTEQTTSEQVVEEGKKEGN